MRSATWPRSLFPLQVAPADNGLRVAGWELPGTAWYWHREKFHEIGTDVHDYVKY